MWDWDEAKRQTNLRKHGIDFAAAAAFDWLTAHIEHDRRQDYGEESLSASGQLHGRLHVLTFTRRDGRIRIISLRKANKREQRTWASRNI